MPAAAARPRWRPPPVRSQRNFLCIGNELIKGYVHPGQMAKDFQELSRLIHALWAGRPTRPMIAGADEIRNMPQFLKAVGPGVLGAAT
jgi:hypothetical protein